MKSVRMVLSKVRGCRLKTNVLVRRGCRLETRASEAAVRGSRRASGGLASNERRCGRLAGLVGLIGGARERGVVDWRG